MGRWSAQSDLDYRAEQDWPRYAICQWCGGGFDAIPGATQLCDTCHAKVMAREDERSKAVQAARKAGMDAREDGAA